MHRTAPFSVAVYEENVHTILSNLHLFNDTKGITNAALLLFARDVQKWFPSASVKCAQFYGSRMEKPILSQQIYDGIVFEVVDKAVYLAGYIEQLGTGAADLIKRCQDLGLRRPEFRQDENFLSILWRKNAGKDDATDHATGHEKTSIRRIVMAI